MRFLSLFGRTLLGLFGLFSGLFGSLWRGLTGYVPPDPVQQQRAAAITEVEKDLDDEMKEIEESLKAERARSAAAKFQWGQPATDADRFRPQRSVQAKAPEPANDDEEEDEDLEAAALAI